MTWINRNLSLVAPVIVAVGVLVVAAAVGDDVGCDVSSAVSGSSLDDERIDSREDISSEYLPRRVSGSPLNSISTACQP